MSRPKHGHRLRWVMLLEGGPFPRSSGSSPSSNNSQLHLCILSVAETNTKQKQLKRGKIYLAGSLRGFLHHRKRHGEGTSLVVREHVFTLQQVRKQ